MACRGDGDVLWAVSERTYARSAVLGVIPARLGSERLPRKPLRTIAGRPLIEWVWRRARSFRAFDALVVATDSEEVASACRAFDADVELTSPTHESGTERVSEVVQRPAFRDFDIIVNVQGDEPFILDEQVEGPVDLVRSGWDIGTAAAPMATLEAWRDPAVVKVVRNDAGGALYFSRSSIPHMRGRDPTAAELASPWCLRHIGVYAFSRDALARWVSLPPGELERRERLEQLRPLAAGLTVGVAVVRASAGGVDTEADLVRAARRLSHSSEHDPDREPKGNEGE